MAVGTAISGQSRWREGRPGFPAIQRRFRAPDSWKGRKQVSVASVISNA